MPPGRQNAYCVRRQPRKTHFFRFQKHFPTKFLKIDSTCLIPALPEPANKLQFQLLQVIKCVIDLLPWQPAQTCTAQMKRMRHCLLFFVSSNGQTKAENKKWLNYSDGKNVFVFLCPFWYRDSELEATMAWHLDMGPMLMLSTMTDHRTQTISLNSQLYAQ